MQVTVYYDDIPIFVECRISGTYYRATREEPEELPEVEIASTEYEVHGQQGYTEEENMEYKQEVKDWVESKDFFDLVEAKALELYFYANPDYDD